MREGHSGTGPAPATGPLCRRGVARDLSTALACPALLLLAQRYDRPSCVDLALLGPVGTLVFARLLADELAGDPPRAWGLTWSVAGFGAAVVLALCVAEGPSRAMARLLATGALSGGFRGVRRGSRRHRCRAGLWPAARRRDRHHGRGVRDAVRQALVLSVLGVVPAVLFPLLQAPDAGLSQCVVTSAVTAGAALRVAARVFLGLGPKPDNDGAYETTGAGERPGTGQRLRRVPDTTTVAPAVLLAGALAVGVAPGFADVVAHAVNEAGSGGVVVASVHRTPVGVPLGLASTALAAALAAVAVTRPKPLAAPGWAQSLRRLRSGHIGDYVAWLLVGAGLFGALALPGIMTS